MRLIDADAFENKEFNVYDAEHEEWYRAVKSDDIDNAPTIDAVPVVRCMDCSWYKCGDMAGNRYCFWAKEIYKGVYDIPQIAMAPTDFCSHACREVKADGTLVYAYGINADGEEVKFAIGTKREAE